MFSILSKKIVAIMKKLNNTDWTKYISLVIAVIALLVSFRSCSLSNKSNEIADKALEHSKSSFISVNRPYLILNPIKDKEKGFFIEFLFDEKGYVLKASFEVYNAGKTPAKNINVEGYMFRGYIGEHVAFSEKLYSTSSPVISLGPGEHKIIGLYVPLEHKPSNEKITSRESGIIIGENIRFIITLPLFYSSDIEEAKRFKTTVVYEFPSFKEARLLATSD
ncbi:MAG: hypothetical protein ABSB32_22270 [Thermodesulfobacteriota bacterium]|jgi:hypothetical protein